ncbi:gamma-glutamyltransferase [Hydrogenovibrio sp. 3SP14C1]|uniref:gamma-glutamyltransferase n=1 Tax=Hydrogenovibrio sp. 3SP14C1 TaxID=3038774 RepID=UPI002415BF3F|nr:gamma-glutamyltransferase [Hydrogenovibrio sp. 3SP14C1]MDG4812282.1 gamma-glutamyltransferase [Hydrogenovibrio sp. 3SP14C1]
MRIALHCFVLLISFFFVSSSFAVQPNSNAQAAVAMPDSYSAEVARKILLSGGNAVDASVAAAFVLAVTYPEAGNLGGGGFMTLYANTDTSQKKQAYFLDYREKAPKAAYRDMYLNAKKDVVPYKSLIGYQASGVPGTVMGMWVAHQRFGKLPWGALLQPAIVLAEKGFVVPKALEEVAHWYQNWIANKSKVPLNFKHYFGGLKSGVLFKQPELATTLKRIAQKGPYDFYFGQTAQLIVEQMQSQDGLITLDDLAHYQTKWRQPIQADWKGHQVISAPPPSSGGVAIVQLLKMKEILENQYQDALLSMDKAGIPPQATRAHFYAELSKRVYADRAQYLGDPDFITVPTKKLISNRYLRKRAAGVLMDEISETEQIKPGLAESTDTTHFSVIDAQGNAVSNTYTLNMPFGSGVVISKAGFLMNDEMDDFSTKPGVANVFGVVGGKANEIAPEKRMLSSMSPTILVKDGQVEMVVGTPGGSSIITSVFQTIVNVIDRHLSPQMAVDAPRVHHQLLPKDVIMYHPDLSTETKQALRLMGYQLKRNNYLGDVQLVIRQQGRLQAASDIRGRGVSKVFMVLD